MKKLWNIISIAMPEDMTAGTFLAANIVCWTLGTLVVGSFFGMVVTQSATVNNFLNILCAAIYAGIIFGLFGGIIFLMRKKS